MAAQIYSICCDFLNIFSALIPTDIHLGLRFPMRNDREPIILTHHFDDGLAQ